MGGEELNDDGREVYEKRRWLKRQQKEREKEGKVEDGEEDGEVAEESEEGGRKVQGKTV